MTTPECPICHGTTALAGNKPYCSHCGWNRDLAIAQLRASLKMMPIGLVLFMGVTFYFFRGWQHPDAFRLVLIFGLPGFMLLVGYFSTRSSLNKLLAVPAPTMRPAAVAADVSSDEGSRPPVVEPSAVDEALLRTSRPREVRMASRGKLGVAVSLLAVLVFGTILGVHLYSLWARTLSFATFGAKDWGLAGIAAFLLLIPFAMWRGQVRECDLLENGEVVFARVIRQWSDRDNSSIEYEFKDFQGQAHQMVAFDYTKNLYEGMSVPVFYDRDNPKRQVAYCSTFHEVVT